MKNADLIDLLSDLSDYMDNLADYDGDINGGYHANEEGSFLTRIEEQLEKLKNQ